jgi:hypothetical protein
MYGRSPLLPRNNNMPHFEPICYMMQCTSCNTIWSHFYKDEVWTCTRCGKITRYPISSLSQVAASNETNPLSHVSPSSPSQRKESSMVLSVLKSLAALVILTLSSIGLATSVVLVMLYNGTIQPEQVSSRLSELIVYLHLGLSGLGITAVGVGTRAAIPHVVKGIKSWFASVVENAVSQKLKQ